MTRLPQSLALRRMNAHRLVLGAVALTAVIAAAAVAALASFAGQALTLAAHHQLAASADTSVTITAQGDAAAARADSAAVQSQLRAAFGTVPVTLDRCLWSDGLGLPAAPGTQPVPLMLAAAPEGVRAMARLTAGTWPGPPARGQPVPAALPAAAAARLRLAVGDTLVLTDRVTKARDRLRLVGIYRPDSRSGPAAMYWHLDVVGASGVSSAGGFVTYGPLVVDPAAFRDGQLAVAETSWVALPRTAEIGDSELSTLAGKITRARSALTQPALTGAGPGGLTVTTGLPALLTGIASNLVVARSLLTIGVLQLLLLAVAAIVLATRLLARQRETEAELLTARGGSRWQLTRLNLAECLALAATATILGAVLGGRLAGLLARTGPLRAAGLRMSAVPADAWWAATATALICAGITLVPTLRRGIPGAARLRRGRLTTVATVARSGADLALVVLALLIGWQLRRSTAVPPTASGGIGVDPVLTAAPVLALAGGTVVLLRLLPLLARAGDLLAARRRRLAGALASWEISRRAVRQSGPALLVVLAIATAAIVLSQHQSWQRSAQDQAAFTAGADVRVDTQSPVTLQQAGSLSHGRGVLDAMPVTNLAAGSASEVLALDARRAAATVLLRPDLSAQRPAALWRPLIPAPPGFTVPGLTMPGSPARLEITAALGPAALRLGTARLGLSVQDAAGIVYSVPAGTLSADGRPHALITDLTPARQAVYPLRLLAMSLAFTMPAARTADATLTITSFAAPTTVAGPLPAAFAPGSALRGWTPAVSSAVLADATTGSFGGGTAGPAAQPAAARWQSTGSAAQALSFDPGYGQLADPRGTIPADLTLTAGRPAIPVIPGIATRAYLATSHASVGQTVSISVGNVTIPVRIIAAVAAFPTVTGLGGALIVDQGTVQDILLRQAASPVPVSEWWLRTAGRGVPAGLPSGSAVTDRARLAAALLSNPLSAAPQQALLAIALAAAVLGAVGFSVSVIASVRDRRSQTALLAALGVSRGAQARLLCLEQLLLSGPAAVTGLLLGGLLARLLIPAVTLTAAATVPVPPVRADLSWAAPAGLAVIVTALPVLAAAVSMSRRPDPATRLRAAESL